MKYGHLFLTQQEHDAAYTRNSDEYIEPWTAYIEETNNVSYNIINWSERCLTIEMLESGTCTFQIANNLPTSSCTDVSYSLDGGKTWTTTENVDGSLVTITTPNLNAGDKVLWKGNATTYSTSYTGEATICSKFAMGTTKFNVSGNIASMLYGDNFEEEGLETTKPYAVSNFFRNASGLIRADNLILPFMKLQQYSFAYMFCNCSSLIEAPQLPATNLSYGSNISHDCYLGMFSGCSSLTKAPKLPATIIASWCYAGMFINCTSLTKAPDLIANALESSCYRNMFNGCSSLNHIKMLATTNISAANCLTDWVKGVAATGTFEKSSLMTSLPTGDSGIPTGWTVEDVLPDYLKIESLGSGNVTITIPAVIDSTFMTSISWSKDGTTWTDTTIDNTAQTITVPVVSGDTVYLKGIGNRTSDGTGYTNITSSANYNLNGDILSLFYGDNFAEKDIPAGNYSTCSLFRGSTTLINAQNLIMRAATIRPGGYEHMFKDCTSLLTAPELPSTQIYNTGYGYMFQGCSSLIRAPKLPATTLSNYCYISMFDGCSSLTVAPELPATALTTYCYYAMFNNCTSLTRAPELPATTLATYCYYQMFSRCSLLTTAPALPATTLTRSCYEFMFRGCPNLTSAPALPATTAQSSCYRYMFNDCTSLTTAPALPATTLSDACYQAMFQGCTSLTTAPELPANTLPANCYRGMFYGCGRLNYVKMLATDISATDCLLSWVYGVSPTGTFVKNSSMTTLPTGANGIPSGWTVVDETP